MKNSSQIITTLLSVLFFGYIFYTYTPTERIEKPKEIKKEGIGPRVMTFEDGHGDVENARMGIY